jgi:hypothetical protein
MESAVVSSAAVVCEVSVQSEGAPRCGRFSAGMEQSPPASASRVGRFCDGMARRFVSPAARRVGRFSTGIEQRPETARDLRLGSFADGLQRVGER